MIRSAGEPQGAALLGTERGRLRLSAKLYTTTRKTDNQLCELSE
jgi:hypothetical protein